MAHHWTLRETLISGWCLFIIGSLILWQLPYDTWVGKALLTPVVTKTLRSYIIPLGLSQEWKMFAPNPANMVVYVSKTLEFADGNGTVTLLDTPKRTIRYPSPTDRPQTVLFTPSYNGNGYRITALSKFDWNIAAEDLTPYRDHYLNYLCSVPDQWDRRPQRVSISVSKVTVPTLAQARDGAPEPTTTIPPATTLVDRRCNA